MIESMATGTPVIAFARGSAPEVVDHGRTGFLCKTVEEAVAAVSCVGNLDRAAIRSQAARRFSADSAVERHVAVYRRLIEQRAAWQRPGGLHGRGIAS